MQGCDPWRWETKEGNVNLMLPGFLFELLSRPCREMKPPVVSVNQGDKDWSSAEAAGICGVRYWRGGNGTKSMHKGPEISIKFLLSLRSNIQLYLRRARHQKAGWEQLLSSFEMNGDPIVLGDTIVPTSQSWDKSLNALAIRSRPQREHTSLPEWTTLKPP